MNYKQTKMKRKFVLLNTLLFLLAVISGWALSKATLAGKTGIFFLYREYLFLNSWWKVTLLVFGSWTIFEFIQYLIWEKYNTGRNRAIQIGFIGLAAIGSFFTYLDFSTFSHGLLGTRFHIGGYLFWVGWCVISFFFIALRKEESTDYEENRF